MSLSVFLTSILLIFFSSQTTAQERREIAPVIEFGIATKEQRKAIEQLFHQYQQAWQELDADVLAGLHTVDVEWINAYARLFRGREALQGFLSKRLFPQFTSELADRESIALHLISTRYLNASAAVIHLYTDFQLSDDVVRRTHFHLILSEFQGEWHIAHSVIMDAL